MIKKIFVPLILLFGSLFLTSCVEPLGGSDSIPPQIVVYKPTSNDTIILGPQEIIYDASDDQGIAKVELYIDGLLSGSFPAENGNRPAVKLNLDSATFVNKTFSYYLKVYDLGGNTSNSDTKTKIAVVTSKSPPEPPFGLEIIEPEGSSDIILSWKDSSKLVDGYEIWLSEVNTDNASFFLYTTVSASTKLMPIPKPPVINYYKIRAFNKLGKSSFSTIINSEGGSGSGILGPASLTATAWGQKEVELNWTNRATNGVYLSVQRRAASSVLWSPIATLSASRTSYTDNSGTLSGGATFYYRVKVIAQTDSGASKEVSVITWPFDLIPASNLIAVFADTPAVAKRMVKLSFKDNSNQEEGNLIERKEGSGGTYQTIAILGSDITVFDDTLITKGRTYFYRVKLTRQGYISKPSNEVSVTVPAPAKAIMRYERKRK
jgi:hypothetical protein